MINDLAEMFDLSRTAVMANLTRLGAESRRGIVERRSASGLGQVATGSDPELSSKQTVRCLVGSACRAS